MRAVAIALTTLLLIGCEIRAVGEPGTVISKQSIEQIVDERIALWHKTHSAETKPPDRTDGIPNNASSF